MATAVARNQNYNNQVWATQLQHAQAQLQQQGQAAHLTREQEARSFAERAHEQNRMVSTEQGELARGRQQLECDRRLLLSVQQSDRELVAQQQQHASRQQEMLNKELHHVQQECNVASFVFQSLRAEQAEAYQIVAEAKAAQAEDQTES